MLFVPIIPAFIDNFEIFISILNQLKSLHNGINCIFYILGIVQILEIWQMLMFICI